MRKSETREFSSEDAEPPESPRQVLIANETSLHVDETQLRRAVEAALERSSSAAATVSVAIVDDVTMRRLNAQYLGHDYETDVLSFSLGRSPRRIEGEIVVSADTAARSAVEAGWSVSQELLLYIIHGALHLVGHRDETERDAAEMRAAEAQVLDDLGVLRSPDDTRWSDVAIAADGSGGRC